jgi:hypothetical protein
MPVCVGPSASAVHVAPTLTLNASTNYNQNSGVLNATVTATGNRSITSVEFQWSTSSTFASGNSAWTAASINTLIPQGTANTARTRSISSLSNNTTYYVRFRTTNASGFVTTSSIGSSFKTYRDILVTFASSSTWTNPVPTSGTNGLAITQIRDLDCRAGGGSGGGGLSPCGGGGAGARTTSASATISGNVAVTVGGGGSDSNGSSTSIGSLLSATGGSKGIDSTTNANGGASGNGNAGGAGIAFGAGGGGGGTNGAGGAANDFGGVYNAGTGGAGWTSGNGEGGRGSAFNNQGQVAGPANTGNGGTGAYGDFVVGANGGSGYAQFKYWGP